MGIRLTGGSEFDKIQISVGIGKGSENEMNKRNCLAVLIAVVISTICANSYLLLTREIRWLFLLIPLYLMMHGLAGIKGYPTKSLRLMICHHGAVLLKAFLGSLPLSIVYQILLAVRYLPDRPMIFVWSALLCIGAEAAVFWNGILCVYCTSSQLGVQQRVIGLLCGMIPIANLAALGMILSTVSKEVQFEVQKEQQNLARKPQQICKTKYPLLMVHGVFFRDTKYFNYWGRVPRELEQNGAVIYYGNHQSASSVADSAAELAERIKAIVREQHCEKVNIIAHSKGGLDCRYALAKLDAAPYVASLTTINTPHRGCLFADYLLTKIPEKTKQRLACVYNSALKRFGDENPDFLAAVHDLSATYCTALHKELKQPTEIFCQSFGSVMPQAGGGKFPLNFSYHLVKHFDGPNDGLVCETSFGWGERYTQLVPKGIRGISHGDMIDLNRQNIEGFDVREFYVDLVHDLKQRGL